MRPILPLLLLLASCGSPFEPLRLIPPPDAADDAVGESAAPKTDHDPGDVADASLDALSAPDGPSESADAGEPHDAVTSDGATSADSGDPDVNPCPGGGTLQLCGALPYCAGPSYCLWDELSGVYTVAAAPSGCETCSCLLALTTGCYGARGGACAPDPTGSGCAAVIGCSGSAPVVTCCGGIGCP